MAEIFKDSLTRRLYANDASMYEELPAGVAFPQNKGDIIDLVKEAAEKRFSVTARSAGTSLAGQATGNGVIMDVSRYMTQILSVDPQSRTAHVEPGVIRDTLNRESAQYGLLFGPDTATTNRCMIGGMIGNNSCGSYSIKYQTTREHTLEIEAVLSDGSDVIFKALSADELEQKLKLDSLEGSIYKGMIDLLKKHNNEIVENYPHPDIIRRNTGYALDRLCEMDPITPGGRPFNLAELLCGSEGTLALTVSAKLNLEKLPKYTLLVVSQFYHLDEAMLATVEAVKHNPSAVELVDDIILNATKGNIEQNRNRFFLQDDPACILAIQFDGDDVDELHTRANHLVDRLNSMRLGYAHPILDKEDEIIRVWELRKAGLGLLMGLGKDSRSPTFVEDTAVRVEDLPEYIREFREILKRHDTRCVFYAHASVGELHLRPMIDLSKPEGIAKMKLMADEVAILVKKYRGSLSGEHGDGRARAPYIERVLGSQMITLLKEVKKLWDPNNILNPGKITDPDPIDHSLRFSPEYKQVEILTAFQWRKEDGFGAALEQCNGAGVCRKLAESGGTMCPSYQVTKNEKDSTRGRANLFRQLFSGKQQDAFTSEELDEALKLCLSCKACKSECPANVDMAKMKAEFLHGKHQKKGIPAADRFFGDPLKMYQTAAKFPAITNKLMKNRMARLFMEKALGVDSGRTLPPFAGETFRQWFRLNGDQYQKGREHQVLLLVDLFTDYHEPETGIAACRMLDELGVDVLVSDIRETGRPQISRGLLDHARYLCDQNIPVLYESAKTGIPVIGLEPSELLTIRDEYPDLCDGESLPMAEKVAANTFLWEEFIVMHLRRISELPNGGKMRKVYLHGHCHTKALAGNSAMMEYLKLLGYDPVELKTGCCGMAGSFGYAKESADVSLQVAELTVIPALQNLPDDALICVPGFSCRHQISDTTGRTVLHPAQLF
jgi:FAD/FMN-containing dehydrogenase/Fe-S oxidoreductase